LNLSFFISKRITAENAGSFSSTISKIALASIAFGLSAILLSFMILGGFQKTIKDKIYSFSGHLQITKYALGNSYEDLPISTTSKFYQKYDSITYIDHVQSFAYKAGLLKTESEVQGIVLKGVGRDYDTARFMGNMKSGRFINFENTGNSTYTSEIVVSQKIFNQMDLQLDEQAIVYFVQNPPRYRQVKVVGIYETGLEDFDEKFIIGDLGLVQRINNWGDTLVGGFEVFLFDSEKAQYAEDQLFETIDYDLYVDKVSEKYLQIFDWLTLLDRNVLLFLVLILFVASFNMVSIMFILIMERTQMIGMLKAMGAKHELIRKIFVYNGMLLIGKGMLIGNLITFVLAGLQYYFKIIPLDPKNYYMEFVPILWDFQIIIFVNILTFLVVSLTLAIPTMIVTRINPIEAIRFNS
jgi:lipoprotein-releasing system permease protein